MNAAPGAVPQPHDVYRERLQARQAEQRRRAKRDRTFSLLRAAAAVAAIVAWALFDGVGLAVGAAVFVALMVAHARTVRARDDAARRAAFYEAALARLDDQWAGRGEPGTRFLDPAHLYAADLDLFGPGSLFERLCTARTRSGQETLAGWLLAPAPEAALRERHAAVDELRPRLDLREDLAVLGTAARGGVDSVSLRAWLSAPPAPVPAEMLWAAGAASLFALLALDLWIADVWGAVPLVFALVAVAAVTVQGRRWSDPVLGGVGRPAAALRTLTTLLARLEREPFAAPPLARLRAALSAGDTLASTRVARLRALLDLHDSRRNIFFAPLAFVLLLDLQMAAAIERWRRAAGAALAESLRALGEIEALSALAAYSFECPEDPFPTFASEGPLFAAQGLTHPLLPLARAVRNDVRLDGSRPLLVVSGSNMSGKSTFLRTIGVNAVLAQAGAPVRARALHLSPLAVGASIRLQDSLQEGHSRFYAEITRVRQVMDRAAGEPALLFLLDEIFHGTNSADRRVGAEAVVRALLLRGAAGLVTSHDLALADIADRLAPAAENVHFEDHLEEGRIAFDYRLKPGRVEKSNALALMRAVGLTVPEQSELSQQKTPA